MQINGVTTGYLNGGTNDMVEQGRVKHAEGKERASEFDCPTCLISLLTQRTDLLFADMNGVSWLDE